MEPLTRTADSVVMARPRNFGFNEQTGLDNEFQSRLDLAEAEINRRANDEFERMVDRLRAEGVDCMILEPDPASQTKLPDAVFPNNWFSTEHDGTLLDLSHEDAQSPGGAAHGRLGAAAAAKRPRSFATSSTSAASTRTSDFSKGPARW